MLVDDEEDVINATRRTIDWESLDSSVPTEAHNGLEVPKLTEDSAPDAVLTDIKMPYMDGLELAHHLKELHPNIRIVVFSGFDEFEYAREALRLEAEEYILKPAHVAESSKLFLRIQERLDAERAERQDVEQLRVYYEKSPPRLWESFLVSLPDGKIPEERLMRQVEDYQLSSKETPYVAAVTHMGSAGLPAGINAVLLVALVRKLMEGKLDEKFPVCFFGYLGNTVILVLLGETGQFCFLTDACDKFCRLAAAKFGTTVIVGIEEACGELSKLRDFCTGARSAFSYRMIYGMGKAISTLEITPQEKSRTELSKQASVQDTFRKMRIEKAEELNAVIACYMADNAAARGSVQEYRFFVMGTARKLYRFAKNNGFSIEEILGDNGAIYRVLQQLKPGESASWTDGACRRIREMIQHKCTDSARLSAAHAIDHVNGHHVDGDLTVDAMYSYLNVSVAYFSTIFKREIGKTFVQYLTDLYMEKAMKLLLSVNEEIYMITQKVGYADPNYFSYIFKRQFDMPPSEYKGSHEVA